MAFLYGENATMFELQRNIVLELRRKIIGKKSPLWLYHPTIVEWIWITLHNQILGTIDTLLMFFLCQKVDVLVFGITLKTRIKCAMVLNSISDCIRARLRRCLKLLSFHLSKWIFHRMKSCVASDSGKTQLSSATIFFLFLFLNQHWNNEFNFPSNKTIKNKRNENKMSAKDAKSRVYTKEKESTIFVQIGHSSGFALHLLRFRTSQSNWDAIISHSTKLYFVATFLSIFTDVLCCLQNHLQIHPKCSGTCPSIFRK